MSGPAHYLTDGLVHRLVRAVECLYRLVTGTVVITDTEELEEQQQEEGEDVKQNS